MAASGSGRFEGCPEQPSAGSFEWACFQAQQAGEKALKAFWLYHLKDPWGHSLVRLIQDFPDDALRAELIGLMRHAKLLDKLYIPTRYPNGLPDLTPAEDSAKGFLCCVKEEPVN